jgi:putative oxidoreductase
MKIVVQDLPIETPVSERRLRLAKPMIDLETAPYAILLLRLTLGTLFIAHGLLKLLVFTLPGTAQFLQSLGLPGVMAYVVTPAEIIGGALLIAGLYTRWVALALFPILLVATFKVHWASGWLFSNEGGGWEFPALFAIALLVQFLLGDGAYSLGSIFHRKR